MPSNVKLLAGASGGEPTDANFKNVTLLLHGDGSNGAQNNTFIDSSTNNFTITRNGNTTQGSFSPYGSNWSNYFDGSGDYISAPYSVTNSEWWTQDFTIEMWVYNNTNAVSGTNSLCLQLAHGIPASADTYWAFGTNASGQVDFYYFNGGGVRLTGTTAAALNTWNHIAMVYTHSSGNISLYLNGSRVATGTKAGTPQNSSGSTINVGVAQNTFYNGYISNLRILDGTALYSGTTYTVPTTPLTAITNTSLLTCAYNRFRDGSTNNFTITRNGDVKVTNFAPFAPSSAYSTTTNGGSAYFDGSGDYLLAPNNTALNVWDSGSGSFTVEAWIYPTVSMPNNCSVVGKAEMNGDPGWTAGWAFQAYNSKLNVNTAGDTRLFNSNTTDIPVGAWSHVVLVKSSSTVSIFQNGTRVATITNSSSYSNTSDQVHIGTDRNTAGSKFTGWMAGIRMVKGTAVYDPTQSTLTVPTSPPTAVTNTNLLLNATNAAIFDNSMKNDLETVGNAQISTSVKKFGTGSMAFDGSGDYLFTPLKPELGYGTGDFTIEFWAYPNNSTGVQVIVDQRAGSANRTAPTIYLNGGALRYYTDNADRITGGSVSASQWSHIALSRSGSSTRLFINGTQTGSTITDTRNYIDSPLYIGEASDGLGGAAFNGYIDDLRITKGVARYTANFTAPTAPFPNK